MDERIMAVIDADFFRHITEHERGIKLFLHVMDDLDMKPVMHEFVAKVELKGNIYLQQLIDTGYISVVSYEDYLKEEDRIEYEEYFLDAYERINQLDFPEKSDIYINMRIKVKALGRYVPYIWQGRWDTYILCPMMQMQNI